MGLFSRKPKSLLPPDPAVTLAEWGRAFPPPGVSEVESSEATASWARNLISLGPEDMSRLVSEIRDIGLQEGGWTAYGAWEILNMTCTRDVPPEFCRELSEPRVRLLHSLGMPDYPAALSIADTIAWDQVFSDEAHN